MGAKSAIFSPEGDRLVIGASGREAIKIWDFEQERELLTLEGDGGEFFSSAFSSDAKALGALSHDGVLHIWRAPSLSEDWAAGG